MSREITREYLAGYVRRQLGEPIIEVELDDDQIEDCIDNALDEIAPWLVQPTFATFSAEPCIDLSELDPVPAYVIRCFRTKDYTTSSKSDNSNKFDVFDVFSTSNIKNTSYSQTIRQVTYSRLENMLYRNTSESLKDYISFKYIKPKLYLDIGSNISDGVVIEYSPTVDDVSTITNREMQTYLKRFTLAHARMLLSDIRGKYTVSGSPVELDASTQQDKANQELEYLRQEMKSTVNTQFIID